MDFARRRAELAERLSDIGADAFLVTRLPNVRYLTGFSGSNGQLVICDGDGVLLTDGRYEEQSRREVPDLRRSVYAGGVAGAVASACLELGASRVAFEGAGLTYQDFLDLTATGLELVATAQEVEGLREVKEPGELALLEAAQGIADDAFGDITKKLVEGMTERQASFELDSLLRQATADGVSFDTILAFGENAAEPHHHPTDRPLGRGDVVKMDFGCVVGGYHSDMTRTVAFGEPAGRLREVYEVVRAAQQAGVDAVRAGVPAADLDRVTRDLIRDAGYGEQFKHPLGHGVGLEIHERPWVRAGNEHPLPAGAVITVEPGVYLEGLGGVRIEDMVEVTDGGGRVIPRTAKELIVL